MTVINEAYIFRFRTTTTITTVRCRRSIEEKYFHHQHPRYQALYFRSRSIKNILRRSLRIHLMGWDGMG